ncbi:probable WRKY transcription factor 49 [Momordica charantia]|uniref:Probable WRKY transcription factor 49 n=1 Tax=Momordica charantia TaxID=3673 RepID=A0A6J1CRV2_MOMCH|nr:probable WRKY transcription factor 49 [Momordica charantia]
MEPLMATPWSDYNPSQDDLVAELLDDHSPLFLLPEHASANKLAISAAAYSGPTIEDIENALSITPRREPLSRSEISQTGFSIMERGGLNKVEHKYSLRIKSCGNMVADDGYKWRKYGQKSIKNSPNPRSYYRCSNPRCSAKKQVERSIEDPDTFIITYEGLHLHFAYPFLLMGQTHQAQSPTKKPKTIDSELQAQPHEAHQGPTSLPPYPPDPAPQGLLEDMVPWMIRNPSTNHTTLSNSSSCSSYRSPPTSPPSPSTCPPYVASCY